MAETEPRAPNQEEARDREPLVQYEDLEQATGFTQVSNAVLRCYPELSDGEKMTYAVLKSFAYVGPETFVGEETLARARAVTVSTVSRHLNRLIDAGLVGVRRRGQGKTNIWIIMRIPREKLEQYIHEWRPNLELREDTQAQDQQDAQVKTSRDPQVKTSENPQAEEPKPEKEKMGNRRRSTRPTTPSHRADTSTTTGSDDAKRLYPHIATIVENSSDAPSELSTIVENVASIAALVARYFAVPQEQASISTYLRQYNSEVVAAAFETVLARLDAGHDIHRPVAYFYALTKLMQAEYDSATRENEQEEKQSRSVALKWARALLRDWPPHQVKAILADTYHDLDFVADIMRAVQPDGAADGRDA